MDTASTDRAAKVLWDYLVLRDPPEKADIILGLGSYDIRTAERCAELFLEGWAPLVVFSGGVGRLTPEDWPSEASMYARCAVELGVPEGVILVEDKSTNTGENVRFTARLLDEKGIEAKRIILVHKPYLERRAYATLMRQWPGREVFSTSAQLDYNDYPNDRVPKSEVIEVMVGDLQRIRTYPEKGFQIYQEIPDGVWAAYEELVAAGYDKYITK